MKSYIKKAISTLLIFTSLIGCSSCQEIVYEYDDTRHVEIIHDITSNSVSYNDEYLINAEERYVGIVNALYEHYSGVRPDVYQDSKIRAQFKLNIIPMLYRIKIYEDELDEVFTNAETHIDNDNIPPLYTLFYDCALEVLGAKRCGQLFYGSSLLILSSKEETAREKYEKYGLSSYNEDAIRYREIKSRLEEMGEERFTESMEIFTSLISLGTRIKESDENGALHLDEASILYVIKYRTKIFMQSDITDDEWSLIGDIFTEILPARSSGFKLSMLYEIKKARYLPDAFRAMPEIIALYASLASSLLEIEDVSFKLSEDEQSGILAKALLDSEDEVYALSLALEENARSDNESQRSLIVKHFGKETLDRYTAISYEELMLGISEIANEGDSEALSELWISYLYGIAPYLTLAYLTDMA